MIDKIVLEDKNNIRQIASFKNGVLKEFVRVDANRANEGNIYLGKIVKKIKTANGKEGYFVNIGEGKDAFINAEEGVLEDLIAIEGQDVVVQVIQEARAEKGTRLARFLQISGLCLVFNPYGDRITVSAKIDDVDKREFLEKIVAENVAEGGWIVRTFAVEVSEQDIIDEIEYLKNVFKDIVAKSKTSKSPCLLYSKDNILQEIICRSANDIKKIIVNNHIVEEQLKDSFNVEYDVNAFKNEGIDDMIVDALQKEVKLKCGGRIIIEETRAFVSIDVDSGEGFVQGNLGILNKEAAIEIARQIILRNLSGKIIIDFAGISEFKFLKNILDVLKDELREDPLKAKVLGLSRAGNVEIVRSRKRPTLNDLFTEECLTCRGTGRVEK